MPRNRRQLVKRRKQVREVRSVAARLGIGQDWYQMIMAAVIGIVMGGVATAFIMPLRAVEHAVEHIDRDMLLWFVALVPIAGAFLAGTFTHLIGPGPPGVPAIMYAIHRTKARISKRLLPRKWLAATATIASGGSAGAEGPIVTIGAVLGSSAADWLRASPQSRATMLGCGAAAGIASVFNAPIAGIFFALEILLRDFSLRAFAPIVIASVMGAACTQAILGKNDALFALSQDFSIDVFKPIEIPNYLMLGIVCGVIGAIFIKAMYFTYDLAGKLRVHPIFKPAAGATVLGIIGLLYVWLAQPGDHLPPFYGNGYPVIRELINRGHYLTYDTDQLVQPAMVLLAGLVAIALLKPLATCLTLGTGGAGGFFAPSLLLGSATGGAFGIVVHALAWGHSASPAQYAVVGMAAMVAAVLRAPLTAILIVYEITRNYEIILPLMLAAVISTVVGRLISRESIYTEALSRLGVRLGAVSDLTLLRRLSVEEVTLLPPVIVHPDESAQRLLDLSEQRAVSDFVVVDENDDYVGMVTGADLRAALVYREAIPLLQVNELQRSDLPTVGPSETLDVVLDKFSRFDVYSLAVLNEPGDGKLVGLITRSQLMQKYQSELSKE